MDRKTVLRLLVVPSLVGLAAAAIVYAYLGPAPAAGEEPRVPVVVARKAIPAKTRLTRDLLVVEEVPARYVTRGALQSLAEAEGKVTLVPLAEGEMVLASRLAGQGAPAGLAYRIPDGYRAVSVKVDEVTGAGGFPQPGDAVDVVAVVEGAEPGRGHAVLLLERLTVLAVNRDLEVEPTAQGRAREDYAYVTVAATPDQALDLVLAQSFARVHLLLRPAADAATLGRRVVRTTEILGR